MLNIPQRVTGISHPFVKDIYLKKSRLRGPQKEDVLVIEALQDDMDDVTEHDGFDSHLADLLTDLKDLEE